MADQSIFILDPTDKTPDVRLEGETGVFEFKGRSIPEDSLKFYEPIFNWLDAYAANPISDNVTVNMRLEYFNTSSSKCLLDLFKKIQNINDIGVNVNVNWYYEEDDDDMMEAGEDYDSMINLNFSMFPEECS
ncbi:MAG: DUF1987 domain-containing protein [Marinifilaceae bacterium]|jgi:hypothetical protein|nr:DUF1987 domain-containing protein [Marinifilaceae bacterium]